MMKKILRRTLIVAIAVALVLSSFVTASDVWNWGIFPTWDEIFSVFGFADAGVSDDELRVTFLDVEAADCIVIQSGDHAVLIDAGEHKFGGEIVSKLKRLGVERLDCIIATHLDADHIGGMDAVIRAFDTDAFVIPRTEAEDLPSDSRVYQEMMAELSAKEIQPTEARFGMTYQLGDAALEIISGRRTYEESNQRSVVCRVTFGEHAFLLMGDVDTQVEYDLLNDGADITADVIKLGHHGSAHPAIRGFCVVCHRAMPLQHVA